MRCDRENRLAVAPVLTPTVIRPSAHVMMRPQHAREPDETAFLIVVEALIERRTGVGDLLQSGAGLGHIVGAPREPFKRRARLLLIAGLARLQPLDAQLNEIANGLLELRPFLAWSGVSWSPAFNAAIRASAKADTSAVLIRWRCSKRGSSLADSLPPPKLCCAKASEDPASAMSAVAVITGLNMAILLKFCTCFE